MHPCAAASERELQMQAASAAGNDLYPAPSLELYGHQKLHTQPPPQPQVVKSGVQAAKRQILHLLAAVCEHLQASTHRHAGQRSGLDPGSDLGCHAPRDADSLLLPAGAHAASQPLLLLLMPCHREQCRHHAGRQWRGCSSRLQRTLLARHQQRHLLPAPGTAASTGDDVGPCLSQQSALHEPVFREHAYADPQKRRVSGMGLGGPAAIHASTCGPSSSDCSAHGA